MGTCEKAASEACYCLIIVIWVYAEFKEECCNDCTIMMCIPDGVLDVMAFTFGGVWKEAWKILLGYGIGLCDHQTWRTGN
jgi:hypothetical protein